MTKITASNAVGMMESVLVRLEEPPFSQISRILIGFLLQPAVARLSTRDVAAPSLIGAFLGTLVALRILPAVLRKLLPFSQPTQTRWAERRVIAKRYDSYQWQKLLWIGIGLGSYAVLFGPAARSHIALAAICLVSGLLGLIAWRWSDGVPKRRGAQASLTHGSR